MIFTNDGRKITSIYADGKNVSISYSGTTMENVEFIEEGKRLLFEYRTYGPIAIKLKHI